MSVKVGSPELARAALPRCAAAFSAVVTDGGRIGSVDFPAAAFSAPAGRTLGIEGDVPEFAGHAGGAAEDLAVGVNARSDSFRDGYHDQVAGEVGVLPEPDFGEGAGVGGVLEFDRQAGGVGEGGFEVHVAPAEVRREGQPAGGAVDAPGEAHADSFHRIPGVSFPQLAHPRHEPRQKIVRVRAGGDGFEAEELPVERGDAQGGLDGADIDAYNGAVSAQPQVHRAAAAREPAHRPFEHPAFGNELLGDQRYGAALQARAAGQVGARDGLAGADQVQDHAPVDVARGLAGGYPKVAEVDLSHRLACILFET